MKVCSNQCLYSLSLYENTQKGLSGVTVTPPPFYPTFADDPRRTFVSDNEEEEFRGESVVTALNAFLKLFLSFSFC